MIERLRASERQALAAQEGLRSRADRKAWVMLAAPTSGWST